MKKIIFGITNMNIGGAEKVLVDLLNNLKDEYDITLLTIYSNGILLNELNKKIKIINLFNFKYEDLNKINKKIVGFLFHLKPYLKHVYNKYIQNKYDTEVAFLEGPITALFSFKSKANKVAWVHTDLSKHYKNIDRYKSYYDNYDKIVFVSNESKKGFESVINNDVEKITIHNYIDSKRVIKKSKDFIPKEIDNKETSFLSVSRLVSAKAIDRLILVSKKLIENNFKHKMYIIGDGPERKELEKLIESLELKETFILMGEKENPYPYIKKSDYFLIPSLYEGYPTVALEGIILEKRIISTDTGAKEALKDYDNKLIVKNSLDGLYDGIKTEIKNNKKILKHKNLSKEESLDKIKSIL